MQEIRFHHVIDYKAEDFTKNGRTYDLILDCKTTRGPFRLVKALSRQGRYITVGGLISRLLQIAFLKPFFNKNFAILALKTNQDLDKISQMYEKGQLKPVHDQPFSLKDAPKAVAHFGSGRHKGKVLIKIE
jgi:NADPH:quinone reductase-like Zn-dependent oxidoreductase